jgi:hypothetical protein
MEESMSIRTQAGTPYCWQAKAVLRKIREACDRTNTVASAVATYVALTEIASDETNDRFTTTHAWIARMSGLGIRTVQARLKELVEIGALAIETPDLRAPSTYHLLAFGNGCVAFGNGCAAFSNGKEHASLPTSEEHQKNRSEEHQKNVGNFALEPDSGKPPIKKRAAGAAPASDQDFLESLSRDPAYQGIDVAREHQKNVPMVSSEPKAADTPPLDLVAESDRSPHGG